MHDTTVSSIIQNLFGNNDNRMLWVGLTDFKVKRYKNRTGWLWSDGSLLTNTELWGSTEPNNYNNIEDCVTVTAGGLYDTNCSVQHKLICQKAKSTHSGYFQIQSNKLTVSVPEMLKCIPTITLHQVSYYFQCAAHCASQPLASCRAFYYNEINGSCVLLPYLEVTLPIEVQQHWNKYVSIP